MSTSTEKKQQQQGGRSNNKATRQPNNNKNRSRRRRRNINAGTYRNEDDDNNNKDDHEENRRILVLGKPNLERCDNRVISARYTVLSFFPMAILEQFRRFANLYFLVVGIIMAVGYYNPNLYESAIVPWTTLGPLTVVIAISLLVEGNADLRRHANDRQTNDEAKCIVLTRRQDLTTTTPTVSLATLTNLATATTTGLLGHLNLRTTSIVDIPETGSAPAVPSGGGNRTATTTNNTIDNNAAGGTITSGNRAPEILKGHDVKVNINKSYKVPLSTFDVIPSRKRRSPRSASVTDIRRKAITTLNDPATARPMVAKSPAPSSQTSYQQPSYVHVAFQRVNRADVRQGHLVLVRNREMVPADIVLLASSNDGGCAYIETSSIDGETNLKLRNSPQIPKSFHRAWKRGYSDLSPLLHTTTSSETLPTGTTTNRPPRSLMPARNEHFRTTSNSSQSNDDSNNATTDIETIEEAVKRITRFSYLGRPDAESALEHPLYKQKLAAEEATRRQGGGEHGYSNQQQRFNVPLLNNLETSFRDFIANVGEVAHHIPNPYHNYHLTRREADLSDLNANNTTRYIAALVTEIPNSSVHTFQGKLVLPPLDVGHKNVRDLKNIDQQQQQQVLELPLDTENILLRGAILRNTEWIIGVAFFTGSDTKLVRNSVKTRSKFSQLDRLMNQTVLVILAVMITAISYLATMAVRANQDRFDELWYAGFNANTTEPWPYLPGLDPPKWEAKPRNWLQYFLLYVTLLTNFIPLSLYISVELVTFCMLAFVHNDLDMYDDTTNTRAIARSTNISDLGRIQYIFSDKTGTLTQNVMRFKRCSVDGIAFGAPIKKSKPPYHESNNILQTTKNPQSGRVDDDEENASEVPPSPTATAQEGTPFHPLRHLLVGRLLRPSCNVMLPTDRNRAPHQEKTIQVVSNRLTFNAEMFLRVMSLCHTVVVEKDLDLKKGQIASTRRNRALVATKSDSSISLQSTTKQSISSRNDDPVTLIGKRGVGRGVSPSPGKAEESQSLISDNDHADDNGDDDDDSETTYHDASLGSDGSWEAFGEQLRNNANDGAPFGYAYQAESPDEGALVSAASSSYGFQVVTRNSSGITLRVAKPSHLEDEQVVEGLKRKAISLKTLAADTALDLASRPPVPFDENNQDEREETWAILAVNKFDSDRKRMSILLRSPPELGNLPILFCKGSDSSMLDANVSQNTQIVQQRKSDELEDVPEEADPYDEWELAQMLNLRAHLGEFAAEGLRTLVLGLRILTEEECREWLSRYKTASMSLVNRSQQMTEVAAEIETNLHIVGATAIEDKLQKGVPDTIATLGKAGIKLWVLTGDKRETAVEIGYSTNVLTPNMHVTEVEDLGDLHVRTQLSMEFLSLVKRGRLPEYQKAMISESEVRSFRKMIYNFQFSIGKCIRSMQRSMERILAAFLYNLNLKDRAEWHFFRVYRNLYDEAHIIKAVERRRNVRIKAEDIVHEWLETEEGKAQRRKSGRTDELDLSMVSDETPDVFRHATTARTLLNDIRETGRLSYASLRELSLASLTAQQAGQRNIGDAPLVDEDTLSMESFGPSKVNDSSNYFDAKKRTFLERAFAIDRAMRKGLLRKHISQQKLTSSEEEGTVHRHTSQKTQIVFGPRALVIEGGALKYLLGDPEMEEILFSVAHTCDAVIACRVSPKQKALLVSLVRHNVTPKPITLAIGDGANDVGMIQEAHVGVGISGKEGQQAVNASDFAIAQFRFLEELILVHGRWDFFRLSTVVLFSFYKNAVLAGTLITFASQTVFSGTSLFDQWLIAMLNFVAGIPIIMTGLFDRCLSKDYVRRNPQVYKATQENELITKRTLLRWICMVFIHLFTLYYFTVPLQSNGGSMTSAFNGLMRTNDYPGNGEGGDLKSAGTVTFSCMIFLFAYKVLYESKSLIHGVWPAFTCRKDAKENVWSRFAYTWIGVTFLSIGFYMWAISTYQLMGRMFVSNLSNFVDVVNHVLGTRSLSWLLITFVPIFGMIFDVALKVYSNLYFPTQTQIHREIESQENRKRS